MPRFEADGILPGQPDRHTRGTLTDTTSALRANSDALLEDLEVLGALEEQKRSIPPSDPRILELAIRIEEVAQRLLSGSAHQRELTEEVVDMAKVGDGISAINETPPSMPSILSEWREAERVLMAASEGSPEALEAQTRMERARNAYRRAYNAAKTQQQDQWGQS
jgi:hypothetical protein